GKNDPDDKPPTLETTSQYTDRIVGQLALYAALLQTSPVPSQIQLGSIPLPFRLPKLWTWLARVLNSPDLLGSPSAPQCLSVVLEVAGDKLSETYGGQFKKLMKSVGEAVAKGVGGEGETGARMRLGLMIERWEKEGKFGLEGRQVERMATSGWYKRQKDKLKRSLRTGSQTSISLRSPSNASSLPGPSPQLAVNPRNEGLAPAPGLPLSGPAENGTVATSVSTTNAVDRAQAPTTNATATSTSKSLPDNIPKLEMPEKKVAWSGLKALLGVLKSGTEMFGPLKSAIGSLEHCIDIFERASKARDEYQELGEKLDQLLGDLAQFNSDWLGKSMTMSVKNLCAGIEAELKIVETKQGRNISGRYIESTEDSDAILECYRRIHEHVGRMMLNANLNIWKIIDEEMT
ncbi:hypothetical protein FRC11_001893, partial [Ceratobasidium sp. 423]